MNDLVSVSLPLNMCSAESELYIPYITYKHPVQKIKYFKNVLVTFSGFCINKNGLIKECHHNNDIQYQSYFNEASENYYAVVDDPKKLIILDNDTKYLAIHHPWFNYYHWICESIFRLWLVRRKLNILTLILPEFYHDVDFIKDSLEPFEIKKIFYIPDARSILVKNLCLPQLKPVCDSYNARHLRQVNRFYRNYVEAKKIDILENTDRVYVSRKLAGRRKVINEEEILKILYKYDFSVYQPEKYTFLEQVSIFSKIRYLVGEHGSGLTNILFMNPKSSVLELHKNKTNELNHPSFLFWYMAEALDINYYHQSCETYGNEDYFDGNYVIDPKLFENNLINMISKT